MNIILSSISSKSSRSSSTSSSSVPKTEETRLHQRRSSRLSTGSAPVPADKHTSESHGLENPTGISQTAISQNKTELNPAKRPFLDSTVKPEAKCSTNLGKDISRTSPKGRQQDLLACSVCLELYDDKKRRPRFLTCHHSYCELCLETISKSFTQPQILCPNCRTVTQLNESGVHGLQINFYVDYMRNYLTDNGLTDSGCTLHGLQPFSFFCMSCSQWLCRDCLILEHNSQISDQSHDVKNMKEAESDLRRSLTNNLKPYMTSLDSMTNRMESYKKHLRILDASKMRAQEELNDKFDKIIENFENRRHELQTDLNKFYELSKTDITEKLKEIQKVLENANKCLSNSSLALQSGNLFDLSSSLENLKTTFQSVDDKLAEKERLEVKCIMFKMIVDKGNSDCDVIKHLGHIEEMVLTCKVEYSIKSPLIPGFEGEVHMTLLDAGLENYLQGCKMFGAQAADPFGDKIKTSISLSKSGKLTATFRPQISGEHKITLTIHGEPIPTSELKFTVSSNEPVWKLGEKGEGRGNFNTPRNVVIDPNDNLFVVDTGNQLIQKFDSERRFHQEFKVGGTSESTELSTCDLSMDSEGKFIVCTETKVGSATLPSSGNTVTIYSTRGTLLRKFSDRTMLCGLCLAVNSKKEIIVSDYLLHCLLVYSTDGALLRRIGDSETLDHPSFICVDPLDDSIIVSDTNKSCLVFFDSDGKYKYRFGTLGKGKGQLNQPFGVALDGDGNILVADSGNSRIQVFSRDGSFISMIESIEDRLCQPRGLTVTRDGHVLVADRDNHCIKCYKYK